MRAEILAVGTELLLGQIVDTNSTYIAEHLAEAGVDCHYQVRVGDNIDRIVDALEHALTRAEAVVVCGGLGPTHDDITREAIAKVMGVDLEMNDEARRLLEEVFAKRNRVMVPSNLQQALVPVGARIIPQVMGTAPGLICPVGDQVIYATPGVPVEMHEMLERAVLPDLRARAGITSIIASRTLRTWGFGESTLAEMIAPRIEALGAAGPGAATIAFLASGIEGVKIRVTVKASSEHEAVIELDEQEAELRKIVGDAVFGVDDQTMEYAVGALLMKAGLKLAIAESFTGGLMQTRVVAVPGASRWFLGGVVSYASSVKRELLSVPDGPVVTAEAAAQMAEGVRELLHADVGLATTGVAGPDPQEGKEPGTAFVGVSIVGDAAEGHSLELFGRRNNMREMGTISSFNFLRHRLLEQIAKIESNPRI